VAQLPTPIACSGLCFTGRKRVSPDVAGTVFPDTKATKATDAGTAKISKGSRRELQRNEQKDPRPKAERSLGHDAIGADSFGIKEEAVIRRQACDGALPLPAAAQIKTPASLETPRQAVENTPQ
jgi:hypothetical protein